MTAVFFLQIVFDESCNEKVSESGQNDIISEWPKLISFKRVAKMDIISASGQNGYYFSKWPKWISFQWEAKMDIILSFKIIFFNHHITKAMHNTYEELYNWRVVDYCSNTHFHWKQFCINFGTDEIWKFIFLLVGIVKCHCLHNNLLNPSVGLVMTKYELYQNVRMEYNKIVGL